MAVTNGRVSKNVTRKTQIFRNHIFADSGWVNEGEGRITNIKDGYWQYLTDTYLLNEDYVFRPVPKEERNSW